MSEVVFQAIICGSAESLESMDFCIPFSTAIVHDVSSLDRRINNTAKLNESIIRRYFIVLFESIGQDADQFYETMEENPQVIGVFCIWNEDFIPPYKQKKLCYIPKEAITLVLTLTYVQFLKHEAEKQVKSDQISLSKIYLRKAEKTKEWIMSNLRAEPCHILVIPLNTGSTNVLDAIQRLQKICAKFGYSSVIIRTIDDYIPKSEIYDKLPYGKLIFEYENSKIISRWLRVLSPIRLYLYGNEQVIPYEWSNELISNETDQASKRTVNDDDWHTFIENEPIKENVKWNFSSKYAQSWKLTQFTPLNLNTLEDNIRFRSALRRSMITFQNRMSTVTAQIFEWFDECLEYGYIQSEFKLIKRDKEIPRDNIKDPREYDKSLRFNYLQENNPLRKMDDKDTGTYSLAYSSNQSNEMINYYSNKSDRIYIWLDNDLQFMEQRFQKLIHPNQWKYFSYVEQCQTFILNQQLQYNPRIYLISSYYLAEQLFTYEHISKIYVAYLYYTRNEFISKWINNFPIIRGIYQNLDSLFEQFDIDLTTNIELAPYHHKEQENDNPLSISFYDIDQDSFNLHRAIIDILLKQPREEEAKQEMVEELRCVSSDNDVFLKQIDNFEQNYHSNEAIQWYTRDTCIYRFINHVLRYDNIESIIKYRFFIIDLYKTLEELHKQIIYLNQHSEQTFLTHYRGQLMSTNEIDLFKQHIGSLISINTFFSTTLSLDVAFMFAGGSELENVTSNKPVIFSIEVDSLIENTRPYAYINFYSAYEGEDEVLFALGSVFRIEKVDFLSVNDNILVIHLKMIDENDLPKENLLTDLSQIIPEQKFLNPIYALVGLTYLFELNRQREQIKSKLEEIDIQFFDNTEDLDNYTKTIKAIQSFIIFIDSQLHMPERNQQTKLLSYDENDMHFNDLLFQLLHEMEHHDRSKENIQDLFINITNIYRSSNEGSLYVQLLLSSSSKRDSEEELRTKLLPSSSLITFYKLETCIIFLQSIIESNKIGNTILILQSDDGHIDNIIDQLEPINSIKYIYLCSKNAFDIKDRRILHGKFQNENDLYGHLYSDNLYHSFSQANQQIDLYKNKIEAKRYFQATEEYFQLFKEYQNRGKNIIN